MGTLSPIIVQTAPEGSYRLLLASWRASSLARQLFDGERQTENIREKRRKIEIAFYGG
jgi:hypothetical protein